MALASLDGLVFRLNPSSISWNFTIKTNVEETIGGRVVQVLGATLSDITIQGEYGQKQGHVGKKDQRGRLKNADQEDSGLSWRLAEAFVAAIRQKMEEQSADAKTDRLMHRPLLFEFPDYGWRFLCYVKSISGGDGDAAITHSVGAFAYKYTLVLFIVEDISDNLNRVVDKQRRAAINAYISRISAGVGWRKSEFNDPALTRDATTGQLHYQSPTAKPDSTDAGDDDLGGDYLPGTG